MPNAPRRQSTNTVTTNSTPVRDSESELLLGELKRLEENDPATREVRERVVQLWRPVANQVAWRYANRGEPVEDLRQTAMVGLMKAIARYDPARSGRFASYLLPTVTGEVKRHFRDHTWAVRVPRRHQENRGRLNRATTALTQRYGRSPTVDELADHLGLGRDETVELIEASSAYSALSLEAPIRDSEGSITTLGDTLGEFDAALDRLVDREALRPAVARLPERERLILALRFTGERTQSEIATAVGCSQMHVSRILSGVLRRLRRELTPHED
ncbi:SigB/SigF/SigG family RNA polymerase sigma factor [Spiractinospora alimapuensis]|uniref:SigB/SigF/SigG family RNA polymerase sigma factor n=1 Tax=Spiractinospora alimapuensis TaxID=2820884 RepID=UPI001F205C83|nr:SigB/SigF/SigG family RNA polymerase sigma factor [Spiractinospora alimapuensis]QVQ50169.1 SigB/SigF/SigG family RNA polymerase sigma factor [Spiractinospora alimapuensis]